MGDSEGTYPLMAPFTPDDKKERIMGRVWTIRMMDLFVGIPSLIIDHDPTSVKRRDLYGGAGTHRIKEKYGVEYRSLSNFWFKSPKLTRLIYKLTRFTYEFCKEKGYEKVWEVVYDPSRLKKCINKNK